MAAAAPGTVLEGPASWYGPGFAGNTTACGGVFDPEGLTLASRELRCGTRVLVSGPSGVAVEATVTDWGPAEWTNRRFDLSAATFRAVHHPGAGVVRVRVEVLGG
jgi:rare lipoprotein A